MWDVFICHAWEDKDTIARPLANALRRAGLKVWYDEFTLTLGDSLRRSIDQGVAQSRYGIVILSPHFFAKKWPQWELNGLVFKEIRSGKTILPIWHNVTPDYIAQFSPALADKLGIATDQGLDRIVREVLRVLHPNLAGEEETPVPLSASKVGVIPAHVGTRVRRLKFSPDGKLLVSSGFNDYMLRAWNVANSSVVWEQQREGRDYSSIDIASDILIAVGMQGTNIKNKSTGLYEVYAVCDLYRLSDGEMIYTFKGETKHDGFFSCSVSPTGDVLALAGGSTLPERYYIWVYSLRRRERIKALRGTIGYVTSMKFSPDGRFLAHGQGYRGIPMGDSVWWTSDCDVYLWDTERWIQYKKLGTHAGKVSALEFSPDGKILASIGGLRMSDEGADFDDTIRFWDIEKGRELFRAKHKHVETICFLAEDLLASGSQDNELRIWQIGKLKPKCVLRLRHPAGIWSTAASSDYLAVGLENGEIWLWKLKFTLPNDKIADEIQP